MMHGYIRFVKRCWPTLAALFVMALSIPAWSQDIPPQMPEELLLHGDYVIDVTINGKPVRLQVEPGHSGPPLLNPDAVKRLNLLGRQDMTLDFGRIDIPVATTRTSVDFGFGRTAKRVGWVANPASTTAEGVIGVYDLPYDVVTFRLAASALAHRISRFELKRKGGRRFARVGIDILVEDKPMFVHFALDIEQNFISARTANFIATRHGGKFVADSEGVVEMMPGLLRPTRTVMLDDPVTLGNLAVDRFAVRIEDYGTANKVGEHEPRIRNDRDETIIVTGRKRWGKPDDLSRIGRAQLAPCSQLTFDLANREVRLLCAATHAGAQ